MKKNLKIVSAAAAALLAVAPIATSVVPAASSNVVQAAATTQVISVVDSKGNTLTKDANSNSYSATINLSSSQNSVSAITNEIIKNFRFKVGEKGQVRPLNTGLVETSVRNALSGNSVSVDAQGNFTSPATTFTIPISLTNGNNVAATLNVNVTPYNASSDTSLNPTIRYNGKDYHQSTTLDSDAMGNASFTSVALNGTVNTAAIQSAFTATVAGSNMPLTVTVDTSKVNTAVGGTYPVTVSATDGNTHRTVTLTFNIQVGVAGAKYQTATSANNADIPVYRITGNAVNQTSTTIKSGTQVPTFGTVTVGNTSYTRINSKNSNEFVLTSVFSNSTTPESSETHTVMVTSKAYSKTGAYLGHQYYAYDNINIVPSVVKINGKTYYKVAGKDEYVRVTNITGTKRTLRHNAFVYWSSYRRNRNVRKMYKGQTVTTYGAAYRFKNGKRYYRITGCRNNDKRYIKAVNFY